MNQQTKDLIRAGVRRAQEDNKLSGRPVNQHPVDYERPQCHCGDPVKARGLCNKHYLRMQAEERGYWLKGSMW
jgi:hypothetical protein